MAFLTSVASNPDAEREGVWTPYMDGIYLRVARMWNPKHDQRIAALTVEASEVHGPNMTEEVKAEIQLYAAADVILTDWACVDGDVTDDLDPIQTEPVKLKYELDSSMRQVRIPHMRGMAGPVDIDEMCIQGTWYRRIEKNDDGDHTYLQIVRYSPELGRRLFADDRYRDMYMFVQTVSNQSRRFRQATLEAMVGN